MFDTLWGRNEREVKVRGRFSLTGKLSPPTQLGSWPCICPLQLRVSWLGQEEEGLEREIKLKKCWEDPSSHSGPKSPRTPLSLGPVSPLGLSGPGQQQGRFVWHSDPTEQILGAG